MESKAILRQNIINRLKNFDLTEKKRQTQQILSDLMASRSWQQARSVGLFMPMPIEMDLEKLFLQTDKKILIPKTLPQRQMIFAAYDPDQLEVKGKFHLIEPRSNQAEIPDLLVVPGLAWRRDGYRIGFGGGYYDRYLAHFPGATASCLFDFQVQDFEVEAHDVAIGQLFIGQK